MDHYVQAWEGNDSWQSLFAANRLCYALVEPSAGIAGVLGRAPGWSLVYHDAVSQLFVATGKHHACG
jgi:hypothetical protein